MSDFHQRRVRAYEFEYVVPWADVFDLDERRRSG
mgnify:CR=1 FL=1